METEDTSGQGLATGESTEGARPPLDLAQDPQLHADLIANREDTAAAGATDGAPAASAEPEPEPEPDTPAVVGADPTRDEARAMFKDNPGLANVLTDTGWMSRDEC